MTAGDQVTLAIVHFVQIESILAGAWRFSAQEDDGTLAVFQFTATAGEASRHEVLRDVENFDGEIRLDMPLDDTNEAVRLSYVQAVRQGLGFNDFLDFCNFAGSERGLQGGGLFVYDFRPQGATWERRERMTTAVIPFSCVAIAEDRVVH